MALTVTTDDWADGDRWWETYAETTSLVLASDTETTLDRRILDDNWNEIDPWWDAYVEDFSLAAVPTTSVILEDRFTADTWSELDPWWETHTESLREDLVETGSDLLVKYGPNKTTVNDITDPVGIAKPTFYQLFYSKSDLYIEIFERELDEFAITIESDLARIEDPQERLEQFFRCYAEFGEGNEFIQQVFLQGDYRDVIGDLSPEQIADLERKEMEVMVPPIEEIQSQSTGPIAEMEPLTVLGIMGSSLGFQVLHKDEFDEYTDMIEGFDTGIYEHLQDTLISPLARGLVLDA